MILLPAIDIQNNQCVRLTKGDFSSTVTYHNDPVTMAQSFERDGAEYIHVINLDGADSKINNNVSTIIKIAKNTSIPVQVGGGIRDLQTIESYLEQGIDRVIVGTMPFTNKKEFIQAVNKYKERIVVSLDCQNNLVKINGWKDQTNNNIFDVVKELETLGVQTIVVTDIEKDGMLEGTNTNLYQQLQQRTSLNVIASGGVSTLDDIRKLTTMNTYGAIIGKALYQGTLSLKEALQCSQKESSLA